MQLKEVRIRLMDYGPFIGKYVGEAEFKGEYGSIHINLSSELSPKVLAACAEMLVSQAKETAQLMTANVIEQIQSQQRQLPES